MALDPAWVEAARGFARRFATSADEADDLAQEALLRLIERRDAVANPLPWLYVVVRRAAVRRRRERLRELRMESPRTSDPWSALESRLDAERLMRDLPSRARRVLVLAHAGWTEAEMAADLGCSVKGIERALHRARAELRRRRASAGGGARG